MNSNRQKIYEVVSRYVPLSEHDKDYRGQCPFCGGILHVKPSVGFFLCDKCRASGNAAKFLSLVEKISYAEACKQLGFPIEREPNLNTDELIKTAEDLIGKIS